MGTDPALPARVGVSALLVTEQSGVARLCPKEPAPAPQAEVASLPRDRLALSISASMR